jgi:hypothetical protein
MRDLAKFGKLVFSENRGKRYAVRMHKKVKNNAPKNPHAKLLGSVVKRAGIPADRVYADKKKKGITSLRTDSECVFK